MNKIFLLLVLAVTGMGICDRLEGRYEVYSYGNGENSSYLVEGRRAADGRCSYLGRISLRVPAGSDCGMVQVLHLRGYYGGDSGVSCKYDENYGGEAAFTSNSVNQHCPDLLVLDGRGVPVAQYDFLHAENQADYWNPGFQAPGFDYSFEDGFMERNGRVKEQIMYRYLYDWDRMVPNGRSIEQYRIR